MNIVIVGENLKYSVALMNFFHSKNDNIKVVNILKNVNELENVMSNFLIDIVIIQVPKNSLNILMLNNIIKKYLNSIIFIIRKNEICEKNCNYIVNTRKFNDILKLVNNTYILHLHEKKAELSADDKKIITDKVKKELQYLGLKESYKGVQYLIEAILILYNFDDYYNFVLEKSVYVIIANKYHKTMDNIKSNIEYTISNLYVECEEDKLLEYLKEYSLYRHSAKKVIVAILDRIKDK